MIKAVIFDMDGLLIRSSPFWKESELQILGELGVPINSEMLSQTPSGLREDEIVKYWYDRYPWQGVSIDEVTDKIEHRVAELASVSGVAMPGVYEVIALCKSAGLPLAIASSSSLHLIHAVMEKLNITRDISIVCSAYDDPEGKPHPGVYLRTLEELRVRTGSAMQAYECLVFEDSFNGVSAAKAAGMKCIAVPNPKLLHDKQFNIADVVVPSLDEVSLGLVKKVGQGR